MKKRLRPSSPRAEAGQPSDGVTIESESDVRINGDVIGRDKVIQNIRHIHQRALTAAEAIEQDESLEAGRLARGVAALLQRLQAVAADTSDTDGGNPFKGLYEYRLGDTEIFFGREAALREFLPRLDRARLTVLHSESGAGKSSLLQAGLAPRLLAAGHLPLYLRPYNREPSLSIKREFSTGLGLTPLLEKAPLREFLRAVCQALGPQTRLVIVLDQFEEFWARSGPTRLERAERERFIVELAECLDDESLNVRWVLALRTESFGDLDNLRPYVRNPFDNDYRLKPLSRAEAESVMRQSAQRRGLTFEDGLTEQVLNDLGAAEIAPPQLQLVCAALFESLPPGATAFTRAAYAAAEGAAGILGHHLERVLSRDLQAEQRAAARRLLESLITSESQRVIRTHAELVAELSARGVTPETLDVILDQLVDSRLLRVMEGGLDEAEPRYELAHDYLLGEIRLDPQTQKRKAAQELLEQEVRAYRRHGTLLTPDRLAVLWPHRADLHFTPEARRFYEKSLAALRRWAALAASVIGLAVFAFVGWRWGYPEYLRQQARQAGALVTLADASPPFGLEAQEVTNEQYRWCLEAGGCTDAPTNRRYFDNPAFARAPAVHITAYHAAAYCAWVGRRLPTSVEWERAARGTEGWPWPWGLEPPSLRTANTVSDDYAPDDLKPVGAFPGGASPEGLLDLVGNAGEWTRTGSLPDVAGEFDWDGKQNVLLAVRGGSWGEQIVDLADTRWPAALGSDEFTGFRCAQSSPP
jgi:hypothetical protein